jgi:hypothetical protein
MNLKYKKSMVNCQRSIVNCRQDGFIAIMSAIIISVLLLAITIALGFSEFFGRFNILDSESKERSSALAEACGDLAILGLSNNDLPTSYPAIIPLNSDQCAIISITENSPLNGHTTIETQGVFNKSYTNVSIVVDNNDFTIISWSELPNF